jgi:alpha-N-arabinofuranosidase
LTRYELADGILRIRGGEIGLSSPDGSPAFMGVRQQGFSADARALVDAEKTAGTAGITAYLNDSYHYDLRVERDADGGVSAAVVKRVHDIEAKSVVPLPPSALVELRIEADMRSYRFSFRTDGGAWTDMGEAATAGLCSEGTRSMNFTGVFFGLFAHDGDGFFRGFSVSCADD